MKKTSCGTIIIRERNGEKELFMAHVTNKPFWDIPKGALDSNETFINAALRELYEESGFYCTEDELIDLGFFEYTVRKDLYLFKYSGEREFSVSEAICNSTFYCRNNKIRLPEVDDFRYIPIKEVPNYCSEGFKKVYPRLLRII